jgi:hypothetical protein
VSDAVRWLTYDEIASELNIERESARQLAIRKRWARQRGNDGKARVGVPEDELQARTGDSTSAPMADTPSDDTANEPSVIQVLTRHISRLERELETVKEEHKAERDRLEGRAGALEEKVTTLEQDLAAERLRAAQLEALKDVITVERRRADEQQQRGNEWKGMAEERKEAADRLAAQNEQLLAAQQAKPRRWWQLLRAG